MTKSATETVRTHDKSETEPETELDINLAI